MWIERVRFRLGLAVQGLPRVVAALSASTYGLIASQLALSWAAFAATGSDLAVGVVFALRMVPLFALGLVGGRLSDRVERASLLFRLNAAQAGFAAVVALASWSGSLPLIAIFAASAILGALDAPRTSASQAYVYDIAGSGNALAAISVVNLAGQLVGVFAGVIGGFALARSGLGAIFLTIAIAHLGSALLLMKEPSKVHPRAFAQPVPAGPLSPLGAEAVGGHPVSTGTSILRLPVVRVIAAYAVATEVLAFSTIVLLPGFAQDVFRIGAEGLGGLFAVRSAGAVVGLLWLAATKGRVGGRRSLPVLAALFGLALLAFAMAPSAGVAFLAVAAVGAAGAALDALNQTLLLANVPENMRGAAMGVWVWAIGTAPLGHLEVGALAVLVGPVVAQSINAVALLGLTVVITRTNFLGKLR